MKKLRRPFALLLAAALLLSFSCALADITTYYAQTVNNNGEITYVKDSGYTMFILLDSDGTGMMATVGGGGSSGFTFTWTLEGDKLLLSEDTGATEELVFEEGELRFYKTTMENCYITFTTEKPE